MEVKSCPSVDRITCFVLLMLSATSVVTGENTSSCRREYRLKEGVELSLDALNLTMSTTANCTVILKADRNTLIRSYLVYHPGARATTTCGGDYVQVGNDINMVGLDTMTSYTFCSDSETEIVSRSNKLWILLRASQKPQQFSVSVKVVRPVQCDKGDYACSPAQCIQSSLLCDGTPDCENGRDEFCYTPGAVIPQEIPSTCFICVDGTCISPKTFVYEDLFGAEDWYLCDGIPHCPDSSDENPDACWAYSHGQSALIKCDRKGTHKGVIKMWKIDFCEGAPQCASNTSKKACINRPKDDFIPVDTMTLIVGLTASLVILACPMAFLIYKLCIRPAGHRPSTTSTVSTACAHSFTNEGEDSPIVSCDDGSFSKGGTEGCPGATNSGAACDPESHLPLRLKHNANKLLSDLQTEVPQPDRPLPPPKAKKLSFN